MAGYFTKLNGHVYEGEYVAGETLANGDFVSIVSGEVKKLTAASDEEFVIDEKTTLWGVEAIRMHCVKEGDGNVFVVENEWEDYGDKDINLATYTVPTGHYVKMRAPEKGDQLIITVATATYSALSVGDTVKPASGGSVAKKS